jgi:hypothetical protein
VKAARDEAAEDRLLRRLDVEVKGLRVEAEGEVDDLALAERDTSSVNRLTWDEVLEVELGNVQGAPPRDGVSKQAVGRLRWPPAAS